MKVLVGCEESQAVCKAFRQNGHEEKSGFSRAGGAQKARSKTFPGIARAMAE